MGLPHLNQDPPVSGSCFSQRTCLRKECGRKFASRRWNQRYCQDGYCLRLVKLWLDRKRQRRCRESEEVRKRHCDRERQRRAQERAGEREQQPSSPPIQNCLDLPKTEFGSQMTPLVRNGPRTIVWRGPHWRLLLFTSKNRFI